MAFVILNLFADNRGWKEFTMKTSTHTEAKRRRPSAKAKAIVSPKAPRATPWGREVLKRIDTLREALEGKKLA